MILAKKEADTNQCVRMWMGVSMHPHNPTSEAQLRPEVPLGLPLQKEKFHHFRSTTGCLA